MTSKIEVCDLCGKSYQDAESLLLEKANKALKVGSLFKGKVTKSKSSATGRITYDNPIEKKEDLITQIDLFLKTLKKHSAEDFILKDLYTDFIGYFKETPLLEQLIAISYKRSSFDDEDLEDFDDIDIQMMNSNILNFPARKALENLKVRLIGEVSELKNKNLQGTTKIEVLLEKSIKGTVSKVSMVKTSIKIPLEGTVDLKHTLEESKGLKIDNIEFVGQYNIPYLTLELNLCWVCSQLFASVTNKEFWTQPLDYHE